MKYVVLVSHGTMAPGLHDALKMLAGEDREDILSTSLINGMGAAEFAVHVRECIAGITKEDEILLFADLVGGSPLTTAADVIAEQGLMERTTMIGGMNMPLVLSAVLSKDDMETDEMLAELIPESRDELKIFTVTNDETEEEI